MRDVRGGLAPIICSGLDGSLSGERGEAAVGDYCLWVIEDDPDQCAALAALVASSRHASLLTIKTFAGGGSLKPLISAGEAPDIVLIDIDLGDDSPSGVELAEAFFSSKKTQVIYTTAYLSLVTSAYKTEHVSLLGKPIKLAELEDALDKAIAAIKRNAAQVLAFSYGSGVKKVPCSQIAWLESSGHRVEIHMLDGMRETYDSLRNLASRLPSTFVRAHKSYIVNLAHVNELTRDGLVMTGGSMVPLSRKYRHAVKEAFMAYLGLWG